MRRLRRTAACLIALVVVPAVAPGMYTNPEMSHIDVKVVICGPDAASLEAEIRGLWERCDRNTRTELREVSGADPFFQAPDGSPMDMGKTLTFEVTAGDLKPYREKGFRLHVYAHVGTPAPNPISEQLAWGTLVGRVDGVLFLADSREARLPDNLHTIGSLKRVLSKRGYRWEDTPVVFRFARQDAPDALPSVKLSRLINASGKPVIPGREKAFARLVEEIRTALEEGRLRHMPGE
jgi:hypothetical protein